MPPSKRKAASTKAKNKKTVTDFVIAGEHIKPGERKKLCVDVAKLYDFTDMDIPIEVVRGKQDGPVLLVCAAVHGDEINGVEITRRLLKHKSLNRLKGTLIAVPIVNVFGFNANSRYLPDRRDLNRMFPGFKKGSLASQMAYRFMNEIVKKCTHGIDLHTASKNRANLPQIRACLDDPEIARMANAFKAPIILDIDLQEGALRKAAYDNNIPMILFEGGEPLRFNEKVIQSGLNGIISVMREIGMLNKLKAKPTTKKKRKSYIAKSREWLRAPHSGILSVKKHLGDHVKKDELMAVVSDPFGESRFELRAKKQGIIVGMSLLPLVNSGDGIFHVADFVEDESKIEKHVDQYEEQLNTDKDPVRFLN